MRWVVLRMSLGIGGCDYIFAAGLMCMDAREECDPKTYEYRCLDARTRQNCVMSKRAGCEERWHEEIWPCMAPNACAMVEGHAECVATPPETCTYSQHTATRCVQGQVNSCEFLGDDWGTYAAPGEPVTGYWRFSGETCSSTTSADGRP